MAEIYIRNGFLLTMKGEGLGTIEEGAVAIDGSEIVAVGKTAELDKSYMNSKKVIEAKGKAVLPGFVDVHIHTSGTITRGQGQDVPEIEWMLKAMAPFGKYTKPEHSIAGSRLGVLEGLKSGVTTFGEIGGNTIPVTENVFIPSGVRATIANTINEIGPGSRPDANKPYIYYPDVGEKKLKDAIELYEKMDKKGDGRINVIFAPHGADFMSKETLFKVKEEAKKRGKLAHMHVAQGGREAIQIKLRYGTTTIKWLDSIGYLDENLIAAHCHHSTDEEVEILAKRGVRYASCPASIGIIDGIVPPLALFIQKGGKYAGLGSDQAAGSTGHNMLIQLKAAALLNKTRHADPSILPTWKTLRIATIEGAQTIGLGDQVGSIEIGKKADVILIDLKYPHLTPIVSKPVRNVAPNLVYYARGDEVETVICNGKIIVDDHKCLTMAEEEVMENAQKAAEEVCYAAVDDYMAADSLLAKAVKKGLL
ncbi:amidohydrolase family protein [Candidatus Bathyarchaeota archaeon]|nr:amidohydrolase family protein [Candidatus Bathyarchaeota archaeon]